MDKENFVASPEDVENSKKNQSADHDIEVPLEELGKLYDLNTEPGIKPPTLDGVVNENEEEAEYLEQLDIAIRDIEVAGNNFIESASRFTRYIQSEAPYGSGLEDELMRTEQFQTLQAACREAPEIFAMVIRDRKKFESPDSEGELIRLRISTHFESLQNILTITMKDMQELMGSVTRVRRSLENEYRNDRRWYEEQDYLKNTNTLLSNLDEELTILDDKVQTYCKYFV